MNRSPEALPITPTNQERNPYFFCRWCGTWLPKALLTELAPLPGVMRRFSPIAGSEVGPNVLSDCQGTVKMTLRSFLVSQEGFEPINLGLKRPLHYRCATDSIYSTPT